MTNVHFNVPLVGIARPLGLFVHEGVYGREFVGEVQRWVTAVDSHFMPDADHREHRYGSVAQYGEATNDDEYRLRALNNVNITEVPPILVEMRKRMEPYCLLFYIDELNTIEVRKIGNGEGMPVRSEMSSETTAVCVFGAPVDVEFTESERYTTRLYGGDLMVITQDASELHHFIRPAQHTGTSYVITFRTERYGGG